MKTLIVMLCLFMVGCAAPHRDALFGLPPEVRQVMTENRLLDATGTRNGSAYRYGSPERGFLNINSNRGYTSSEYNTTDGKTWSVRTSGGRVTSWSISGF